MWLHPTVQIDNLWMGVSYGDGNRAKSTLVQRLAALNAPFAEYAYLHQVHGNDVVFATTSGPLGSADALISNKKGLGLVVQTADCVPVFLVGGENVAVVHAGWRGVASNIISEVCNCFDKISLSVICPCISMINYEVGEEVVTAICRSGVDESEFVTRQGYAKPHVDLRAAVSAQLKQNGVENIEIFEQCTYADQNLASYRRDRNRSGRILSVIGWLKN